MNFDTLIVPTPSIGADVARPIETERGPSIAGYALVRRIGTGGYGEVWEAVGPGGLPKAVKILHGSFDGRQAETELKALERIRQLRHPFLINLERFEVIDGQLIVVMELAECNLEQHFATLVSSGAVGIPRDELLRYLGDAAEALDFMYEQHGFQHLDVKPANLLIQSGHVKVGDFGLTKDLQELHVSVMTGFTPAYAAPELFEGKPGRNSDQYALAILYQNMLTGSLPFSGRTIAQLASQHLRGTPDLSPLPPADRRIVGRALTKHASARFPTCVDFVKSLIEQGKSRESGAGFGPQSRKAECTDRNGVNGVRTVGDTDAMPEVVVRSATPLPTIGLNTSNVRLRPTLFLGVGGLGGRVLQALRERFQTEYGENTHVPAFSFLSLDSDKSAQRELLAGDSRLLDDEVLSIPLRSSAEYRAESPNLLPWISRRWLFNIPRSQQTAGIRALGRLAIVDHADAVRSRLRILIQRALAAESAELTRQIVGLGCESTALDVVLVGAVTGGMGSGAMMDLAYLVKSVVAAEHASVGRVQGLVLLPTPSQKRAEQLAQANARAWLREWKRFSQSIHGFPGDSSCLLPPAEQGPFDETYLIHCEECDTNGYRETIEEVAEYLFRRSSTVSKAFFEMCRDQAPTSEANQEAGVRLFGLVGSSIGKKRTTVNAARRLAAKVLADWIGDFTDPEQQRGTIDHISSAKSPAERIAEELEAAAVVGFVSAQCRRLIGEQLKPLVAQAWKCSAAMGGASRLQAVLDAVHSLVHPAGHATVEASDASALRRSLTEPQKVVRRVFQAFVEQLRTELVEGGRSIADTDTMLRRLAKHAEGSQHMIQSALDALTVERQKLLDEFGRLSIPAGTSMTGSGDSPTDVVPSQGGLHSVVSNYTMLECCIAIHLGVTEALQRGVDDLKRWQNVVATNLAQCITLQTKLASAISEQLDDTFIEILPGDESSHAKESATAVRFAPLVRHLLQAVFPIQATEQNTKLNPSFSQLLSEAERFVICGETGTQTPQRISETNVEQLVRKLPNAGGSFRCLAVGPETPAERLNIQELEERLGAAVAKITIEGENTLLGFEAWSLDPELFLNQILGTDPTVAELAKRLHSRIDVNW